MVLSFACAESDKDCCGINEGSDKVLAVEWLLFETGYSLGAGYVVNAVPADPPQKMILNKDMTATITVSGLEEYKFFRVLDDPNSSNDVLSLYKTDPGNEPQDVSNLQHSYSITFESCNLKLLYRWCIEGCHMSFKCQ